MFAGARINGHPPVDIADAVAPATSTQDAKDPKSERPVSRRVRFTISSSNTAAATTSTASPSSSIDTLRRCLAERDAPAHEDPKSQCQDSQVAGLACNIHDDETIQPVPVLPTFTRLRPRHNLGLSGLQKKEKKKLLTRGRLTTEDIRDGDRYESEESLQPLLPTGATALRRVSILSTVSLNSLKEKAKGLLKKGADKVRGLFCKKQFTKGTGLA